MHEHYYLGIDLGQRHDYTAIAVLECGLAFLPGFDFANWTRPTETQYNLRHLDRLPLGTAYTEVVSRVQSLVASNPLSGCCTVIVDATGVGAPVIDLLRKCRLGCTLIPVTITAGDSALVTPQGHRVPKRDLIHGLQLMLEQAHLRVAASLPHAETLVRELLAMRVKISLSGNDLYGAWREGDHDDLVLAVSLACWRARAVAPSPNRALSLARQVRMPAGDAPTGSPGIHWQGQVLTGQIAPLELHQEIEESKRRSTVTK